MWVIRSTWTHCFYLRFWFSHQSIHTYLFPLQTFFSLLSLLLLANEALESVRQTVLLRGTKVLFNRLFFCYNWHSKKPETVFLIFWFWVKNKQTNKKKENFTRFLVFRSYWRKKICHSVSVSLVGGASTPPCFWLAHVCATLFKIKVYLNTEGLITKGLWRKSTKQAQRAYCTQTALH